MKKILYFVVTIATLGLVSCEKKNTMEPVKFDPNEIVLNLNVASYDDNAAVPGRHNAMKAGWVNGDKINIWFDANQENPDLVIKFDGTAWAVDGTATVSGNAPAASGILKCLYEGHNNLASYSFYYGDTFCPQEMEFADDDAPVQPLTVDCVVPYTYANKTLTATMTSWEFLTLKQVVVVGAPNACALKCNHLIAGDGFSISADHFGMPTLAEDYYVWCVDNADGKAFYFCDTDTYSPKDFVFTLYDVTTSKTYTYTAENKTLDYYFQSIKLNFSNFTEL